MAKQDFRSQTDNIKAGFQALFNDASKNEIAKDKVKMIPVSKTDPFRNHPFYVRDDAAMEQLVESIREQGIISPIKVRPKADGRYELISGHRRKHACERLGITDMPALIVDMTDEEATIQMVDANLQREKILPSEKAFAYKMKLDAMKRQGKRNDLTSSQVGTKLRSDVELAEQVGESRNQIQRYIRLTYLMRELLEMVDHEKMAVNTAVELSYLSEPEQNALLELLHESDPVPSLEQAADLKRRSKEQPQTKESIHAFLTGRRTVQPFELPPLSQEEQEEEERIEELGRQTKAALEQFRRANASKPRSAEDPDDDDPDFKITRVRRATEEEQAQQLEQRVRKDLEKLEALYAKQLTPERLIEFRTAYNALLRWFYKEGC